MLEKTFESSRIRLEGQLEVVESVARQLEEASADNLAFFASTRSPEVLAAIESVRALADEDDGLSHVLNRLDDARARFAKVIERRLRLLKLPPMALGDAVTAVSNEPIRYRTKSTMAWHLANTLAAGLVAFWLSHGRSDLGLSITILLSISFPMALWAWGHRAIVTPLRLLVGGAALPLSTLALRRSANGLVICRRDGVSIGYTPSSGVAQALKDAGVPEVSAS